MLDFEHGQVSSLIGLSHADGASQRIHHECMSSLFHHLTQIADKKMTGEVLKMITVDAVGISACNNLLLDHCQTGWEIVIYMKMAIKACII